MLTHVEFFVSDVERSVAFYTLLGFEVLRRWEDWVLLGRDGATLVLQADAHAVRGPHYFTAHIGQFPRGVGVETAIEVGDVDALHDRAIAAGVEVVKPLQDRPWGARDFRVADPDGYFIRFTSALRRERA